MTAPSAEQLARDVLAAFEQAKAVGAEWGFVPDGLLLSDAQVRELGWEDIARPADGMVTVMDGPLDSWQDMLPRTSIPECSCRWLESPAMRIPDSGCSRHTRQYPDWDYQFPRSTICRMDWSSR